MASSDQESSEKPTLVYKILTPEQWDDWSSTGYFHGAGIDLKDGFIHLSTSDQVVETYEKYYAGHDVVLVTVNLANCTSEVKWEPSRNNALFPHVYGDINEEAVKAHQPHWDGSKPDV